MRRQKTSRQSWNWTNLQPRHGRVPPFFPGLHGDDLLSMAHLGGLPPHMMNFRPPSMTVDLAQHLHLAQQLLAHPQQLGGHMQMSPQLHLAQQLQLLHPGLPLQPPHQQQFPSKDQSQVLLDPNYIIPPSSSGLFSGFPGIPPPGCGNPSFILPVRPPHMSPFSPNPPVAPTRKSKKRPAASCALDILAAVSEAAAKESDEEDTDDQESTSPSAAPQSTQMQKPTQEQVQQQAQQQALHQAQLQAQQLAALLQPQLLQISQMSQLPQLQTMPQMQTMQQIPPMPMLPQQVKAQATPTSPVMASLQSQLPSEQPITDQPVTQLATQAGLSPSLDLGVEPE